MEIGSGGGAWNRDGVILFTLNPATSLYRVPAAGGEPRPATVLDSSLGETFHGWPQFLPDGRHFLYLSRRAHLDSSGIYIGSLDSSIRKRVLSTDSSVLYASGHLLYQHEHTLMAQPFDVTRFELTGEALIVAEKVGTAALSRHSSFSVSESGVLAYDASSPGGTTQLVWFDRAGRRLGTVASGSGDRAAYSNITLSPDGTKLAVDRWDAQTPNRDIWVFDLKHGAESRMTFDAAGDASPVWSPDGSEILFFSARRGTWNLFARTVTGDGDDHLLLQTDQNKISCDWSRDGYILFRQWDPTTGWDLWVLPMQGDRKP